MNNLYRKIKSLAEYENAEAESVCKFGLEMFYSFEKSVDETNINNNFEVELNNLENDAENFLEVITTNFQGGFYPNFNAKDLVLATVLHRKF